MICFAAGFVVFFGQLYDYVLSRNSPASSFGEYFQLAVITITLGFLFGLMIVPARVSGRAARIVDVAIETPIFDR